MKQLVILILLMALSDTLSHAEPANHNPLTRIPVTDIAYAQVGRWTVTYDGYFPIPVATHSLESMITSPKPISDLFTNLVGLVSTNTYFIPLGGYSTQIGLMNSNCLWLATIEVSNDGQTIVISDSPINATNLFIIRDSSLSSMITNWVWNNRNDCFGENTQGNELQAIGAKARLQPAP